MIQELIEVGSILSDSDREPMNLVICMAGRNTRFHDVGIDIPKYLLPVSGRPVIEMIIQNLVSSNSFMNVYLVAHQRDIYFRAELEVSLLTLGVDPGNLIYIGETKGQADTANVSLEILNLAMDNPIVFHNADTILLGRNIELLKETLHKGHGSIDVFPAESPSYSYVDIQEDRILDIVEKRIISKWATSGLYGFPTGALFQSYFKKFAELAEPKDSKEYYISDIINLMLAENVTFEPLSHHESTSLATLVIGSPEEYRSIQSSPRITNHVI
jgi:UDP-N-acetylglucosamine diphosphorylase / glucose-1-phosphate thymidylyltransferase / UDP-N-acetylgalactosamine diphosphorylase / glucosamine-1-phosphate N-acetyltransferase / galactosamine-1-phosphate N-acetyltransferase